MRECDNDKYRVSVLSSLRTNREGRRLLSSIGGRPRKSPVGDTQVSWNKKLPIEVVSFKHVYKEEQDKVPIIANKLILLGCWA